MKEEKSPDHVRFLKKSAFPKRRTSCQQKMNETSFFFFVCQNLIPTTPLVRLVRRHDDRSDEKTKPRRKLHDSHEKRTPCISPLFSNLRASEDSFASQARSRRSTDYRSGCCLNTAHDSATVPSQVLFSVPWSSRTVTGGLLAYW